MITLLLNYDAITIFLIYCRFGAIGKPQSGCSSQFSLITTFHLAKTENRIKVKTPKHSPHVISLKKVSFCLNILKVCKKVADISKM